MTATGAAWFDDAAGPLVRPYALTGGRTRSTSHQLDLITLVVALRHRVTGGDLGPVHQRILTIGEKPLSVAEVASKVDLPPGVVKVLICDLIDRNHMIFRTSWAPSSAPNKDTMQKVLDGIRKI